MFDDHHVMYFLRSRKQSVMWERVAFRLRSRELRAAEGHPLRSGVGPLGMLNGTKLRPVTAVRSGKIPADSYWRVESVRDPVESNHPSRDAWGSAGPMPPRSPLGRFLPTGRPPSGEPDRRTVLLSRTV